MMNELKDEITLGQLIDSPQPLEQFFPLAVGMAACLAKLDPNLSCVFILNLNRFRLKVTLLSTILMEPEKKASLAAGTDRRICALYGNPAEWTY